MLTNCKQLHLVDPHFRPEKARYRNVLEALANVLTESGPSLDVMRVHCSDELALRYFDEEAAKMAARLPVGVTVEFVRLRQRAGGDELHNRYVLTEIGGVALGIGLDEGELGETDDLLLLPRAQYEWRWSQYVAPGGAFDCIDRPSNVVGARARRPPPRR